MRGVALADRRRPTAVCRGGDPRTNPACVESNAKSLSPITVAWELTRTSDLPRSKALSLLAGQTSSLFLPQKSRFTWDNGRFHSRTVSQAVRVHPNPKGQVTEVTNVPPFKMEVEVTFDGQKRYCGTKSELDRNLGTLLIDPLPNIMAHEQDVRFVNADFFYQVGFHIPERAADYEAKRSAKSLPLYLVEQGASVIEVGREEVDGVSCTALVLRSGTAENRFVLDPSKGYAVRRRVANTPSGELAVRAECLDLTPVSGSGLWMPKTVEVEWHTWPGVLPNPVKEAVVRETFRVSELNSEPIPPEQFRLKYDDPGTTIADGGLEGEKDKYGRVSYYVPADPGRLDEVIKAAASGKGFEPTIVAFRRKFILANVLLILILIGVVWWRFGRKSR